jgi:membrane-bound lytic murein transglycosylase F
VAVLAAAGGVQRGVDDDTWTDKYDRHFRKYSKHYFGPHVDWQWFKAQAITESGLRPNARGPAGGRGIMQVLPTTFAEIKLSNPHLANVDEPKWNIAAGIYYNRQMYRRWDKGFPFNERLAFAFGSYNAGPGRISKAYKRASKDHDEIKTWEQVAPHAPKITRNYIRKIRRLMGQDQETN